MAFKVFDPMSAQKAATALRANRRKILLAQSDAVYSIARRLRTASQRLHALGYPLNTDQYLEMAERCDKLAASSRDEAFGKCTDRPAVNGSDVR